MVFYEYRRGSRHLCLPCNRRKVSEKVARERLLRVKKEQVDLRRDMLAAYGNRCACCGETTPEFLALDHVRNDGAAHRREVGTGRAMYRWLRRNGYPQDGRFQLLCHNCNMAKQFYKGCPHERVSRLVACDGR